MTHHHGPNGGWDEDSEEETVRICYGPDDREAVCTVSVERYSDQDIAPEWAGELIEAHDAETGEPVTLSPKEQAEAEEMAVDGATF